MQLKNSIIGVTNFARFFWIARSAPTAFISPGGYLTEAVAKIQRAGGILIADEVQAGLGRLGTDFWAWQGLGITADIVTVGKPMGNGHPIGAVITRRDILKGFQAADRYFNTYAVTRFPARLALRSWMCSKESDLQKGRSRSVSA